MFRKHPAKEIERERENYAMLDKQFYQNRMFYSNFHDFTVVKETRYTTKDEEIVAYSVD